MPKPPQMPDPRIVAISCGEPRYPAAPPFGPSVPFPEYPFGGEAERSEPNHAYRTVRQALRLLDLDAANYDTAAWNPLGAIVRPGDTVVLKPNFIRDFHDTRGDDIESVITHGSVIRAALDYVAIALQGRGRVIIADAPQSEASFEKIKAYAGLDAIQAFYRKHSPITVDVIDLRPECAEKIDGVIVGHKKLAGDPAGYTKVNLGRHSEFMPINHLSDRLYGAEYDRSEIAAHHHDEIHEYLISRSILAADVFINLPKMKTHKKVGVTLNLKNLVGINGNKNWLPHHREGVPADGGDQFASSGLSQRLERILAATFKRYFPKLGRLRSHVGGPAKRIGRGMFGDTNTDRIRSGNWHGNDTTWRMVLDLNRALRYADGDGVLHDEPQRRYFCIVDGIIAGEGNGPTGTDPRAAGIIAAGASPLAVDVACARLMGFDYQRIPVLLNALRKHHYRLSLSRIDDVICRSNRDSYNLALREFRGVCLGFRSHFGWVDEVEWPPAANPLSSCQDNECSAGDEAE